ncbi:hypothetical protein AQPE_3101 [Aquipluma nitroreducens]|uniref:Uncharacterized protein n=1 Tax=Aquipluma nitroreducens TaxID=2010828 RepID=A0A5K7SBH7_9BACT|nr:hypothetical protein AQPE_3101 [Aquipluma nitroreducens]
MARKNNMCSLNTFIIQNNHFYASIPNVFSQFIDDDKVLPSG